MSTYTNRDTQKIVTTQEIGRGGEGVVYQVAGRADVVAKIYHADHRTLSRQAKLTAMLTQPPVDRGRAFVPPHVALAWPTDLLFEQGAFAGFLMPRIERSPNLVALFNPVLRRQRFPQADYRFLCHTACNLAAVLAALHSRGHVVGDLNQKNILVKANTLVTLVDTDSFQIRDGVGHCYHCPVGVPDYTPPELQGQPLATLDRQPYHDCFGLAVLIFQLLMEGYHPFTGRPLTAALADVDQLSLHCMQQGWFPYSRNAQVQPPPAAPPFFWLPPEVRRLFLQTFLVGHLQPTQRPTAVTWAQALSRAEADLVQCRHQHTHWYGKHLTDCPICGPQPKVSTNVLPSAKATKPMSTASAAATKSQGGISGCLLSLLLMAGFCYGGVIILMLARNGLWPCLVPALLIMGLTPVIRQNLGPLTVRSCRLLATNLWRFWQWTWAFCRWLAPRIGQGGRAAYAFWRSRPPRVKELTMAALLIALLVTVSYCNSAPGRLNRASVTSPLPTPMMTSPLATPTTVLSDKE
ncbi:MAG: hypothetical protein R3C14_48285 [Caldilineaceae bacterium]